MPTEDPLRARRGCPVGIFRFGDAVCEEEVSRFVGISEVAMGLYFESRNK